MDKGFSAFNSLSVVERVIKVSSFLKSDKVAIQLHGIQKMNEALAAMRLDEEHYIFLGPATVAFIHQPEPVRSRAAKILENYFSSIWREEGRILTDFQTYRDSEHLLPILHQAMDWLEKDEKPVYSEENEEATYMQWGYRHGLDLLMAAIEDDTLFLIPNELQSAKEQTYAEFIMEEFSQRNVSEVLKQLFDKAEDPYALKRIVDFFRKSNLDVDENTTAFDFLCECIEPADSHVEYNENPKSFWAVIETAMKGAYSTFATSFHAVLRDLFRDYEDNRQDSIEQALELATRAQEEQWPIEHEWRRCFEDIGKAINTESSHLLNRAFNQAIANRVRLLNSLNKIIFSQHLYREKLEIRMDLNRQVAIHTLFRLGDHDSLCRLIEKYQNGYGLENVSFSIQELHKGLAQGFGQMTSDQQKRVIEHLLVCHLPEDVERFLIRARGLNSHFLSHVLPFGKWMGIDFDASYASLSEMLDSRYAGKFKKFCSSCKKHQKEESSDLIDKYIREIESINAKTLLFHSERKGLNTNRNYIQSGLQRLFINELDAGQKKLFVEATTREFKKQTRHLTPTGQMHGNKILRKLRGFAELWKSMIVNLDEASLEPLKTELKNFMNELPTDIYIRYLEEFSGLIYQLGIFTELHSVPNVDMDDILLDMQSSTAVKLVEDSAKILDVFNSSKKKKKLILWLELLTRGRTLLPKCPITGNDDITILGEIDESLLMEAVEAMLKNDSFDLTTDMIEFIEVAMRYRYNNYHYGFAKGGLNKFVRKFLAERPKAAYETFAKWSREIESDDLEEIKLAWKNHIAVADYINRNNLPPFGEDFLYISREPDIRSNLIKNLNGLPQQIFLLGKAEKPKKIKLSDSYGLYSHAGVLFASADRRRSGAWHIVPTPSNYFTKTPGLYKNTGGSANFDFQTGDYVLGRVEKIAGNKFKIDLGDDYVKGIWEDFEDDPGLHVNNLNRFFPFEVINADDLQRIQLSHMGFKARFLEELVRENEYEELTVTITSAEPENVKVHCGTVNLTVPGAEITWGDPDSALANIRLIMEQNQKVTVRVVRGADRRVYVSFKRKKPVWQLHDLAHRFGTMPFQLVYIDSEKSELPIAKNELLFEVVAKASDIGSKRPLISPGTLCTLSAERLIDKQYNNYHPATTDFPPRHTEIFTAQWIIPSKQDETQKSWVQEEEAMLKIYRSTPYYYRLHPMFSISKKVTIEPTEAKSWAERPIRVRITDPIFENDTVNATMNWENSDFATTSFLSKLQKSTKAVIDSYDEETPVVRMTDEEMRKLFTIGEKYPLTVRDVQPRRNKKCLCVSYADLNMDMIIEEENLSHDPHITTKTFKAKVDQELHARYIRREKDTFHFSLVEDLKKLPLIRDVRKINAPGAYTYIGFKKQGFETHLYFEDKENCRPKKILSNCFQFIPFLKDLVPGERVEIIPGDHGKLNIKRKERKKGTLRSVIENNEICFGVIIKENKEAKTKTVLINIPDVRPLFGRVFRDDLPNSKQENAVGKKIKIRINSIMTDFSYDPPRYYPQLTVEEEFEGLRDALFIEKQLCQRSQRTFYYLRGKIIKWSEQGLYVNVHGFDPSLHFIVPPEEISWLQSRRRKEYWEWLKRQRDNGIRDFRVLPLKDKKSNLIRLSLKSSRWFNMIEENRINAALSIDKDYALLSYIPESKDQTGPRAYIFETATLRNCRVKKKDFAISKEKLLTNFQRFSLFSFKVQGNKLTLRLPPISPAPLIGKNEQFNNRVLSCQFVGRNDDGKTGVILFPERVVKLFPQLRDLSTVLILEEKIPKPSETCLVIFNRLEQQRKIAFFKPWNKSENQKTDIEVNIIRDMQQENRWIARHKDMPELMIPTKEITSIPFYEKHRIFDDSLAAGTLYFNPKELYPAVYIKKTNTVEYISLKQRKVAPVDRLDEYLAKNPVNRPIIMTCISKTKNGINMEFTPGRNYQLPFNRFDQPHKIRGLNNEDRVIVKPVAAAASSYQWEVTDILCEQWYNKLSIRIPISVLMKKMKGRFFEKISFTFLGWYNNKQTLSLKLDRSGGKKFRFPVSALAAFQRKKMLWLKPGDKLDGKLTVAYEKTPDEKPIPYSEHCIFAIERVTTGAEHSRGFSTELREGGAVVAQLDAIVENRFVVSWEIEQKRYKGVLSFSSMSLLEIDESDFDKCIGLALPLMIIDIKNGCRLSYDRYLIEKVDSFDPLSTLPGKVLKPLQKGAIVQFPGFVRFIPYDHLLYGYREKGWLPENQLVYVCVKKWRPSDGVIDIARLPLLEDPSYFTEQDSVDVESLHFRARSIYNESSFLIVKFDRLYGVIDKEFMEGLDFPRKNNVFQIGFQETQNDLQLIFIKDTDYKQRRRESWHRMNAHFTENIKALLSKMWLNLSPADKKCTGFDRLMMFARELDNRKSIWRDEALLPVMAHFLASEWTPDDDFVSQRYDHRTWRGFLSEFAIILKNRGKAISKKQKRSACLAADFLFFKMYWQHPSNKCLTWSLIYEFYSTVNQIWPGRCHALIAQLYSGLQSQQFSKNQEISLIMDIVSRFSFNFISLLNLHWPVEVDFRDAGIHLKNPNVQRDLPAEIQGVVKGLTPENIPAARNKMYKWIKDSKSLIQSTTKLSRLYYFIGCLYFIEQNETLCFRVLEDAKRWLFRETRNSRQMWKERIQLLKLCALFTSARLNQREKEKGFVEYLEEYLQEYDPERRSDLASFMFAASVALSLRDYDSLDRLIKINLDKHQKSQKPLFLIYLFDNYLSLLKDEAFSSSPRLSVEGALYKGTELFTFDLQ